jgi:hypothetical protein
MLAVKYSVWVRHYVSDSWRPVAGGRTYAEAVAAAEALRVKSYHHDFVAVPTFGRPSDRIHRQETTP